MLDIMKSLGCPYKRYLVIKKIIHKSLRNDIFDIYELRSYKKLENNKGIQNIIDITNLIIEKYDLRTINHLQELYLSHRFDILGSGNVYTSQTSSNNENVKSDLENQTNHPFEFTKNYKMIDWNIDLKTKYKFSTDEIYKDGRIVGVPEQVDVKGCWDLSRMYHLVLLSVFSLVTKSKVNVLEFKNQVMDFYIHNPIGYGINWCGSMNASIRATNLLIAYDIFKQIDSENVLDDDFEHFFSTFMYQHGRFIINNLEADLLHGKSHNHYLSNIVGLLYISAYINDKSAKKWWNFAKNEFFYEIDKQFSRDGSNFEGSTSYHRLSGEMFIFGMAIILRVDGNLPEQTVCKLWKAAYFSQTITKRSNKVVQIGDNDSGRFLKFTIQGDFISLKEAEEKYKDFSSDTKQSSESDYFDEDFLNHDTFIACVAGLIDSLAFSNEKSKYPLEVSLIKSISQSYLVSEQKITHDNIFLHNKFDKSVFSDSITNTIMLDVPNALTQNGKWTIFENFGLCCYKSDVLDFYIFAGRKSKNGVNSHIHNDKLHFEFCINGNEYFRDPGTGVYTSSRIWRERFRSYQYHNVPDYGSNIDKEISVFCLDEKSNCDVISLSKNSISLFLYTDTIKHLRKIIIHEKSITVEDYGNQKFDVNLKEAEYFSSGYGKIEYKNENVTGLKIIKTKRSFAND